MTRVLFVDASVGGVVGGSLTGLVHLIRGLDAERCHAGLALYEHKGIETELARIGVTSHYVARRRLPKKHLLSGSPGYRRMRRVGPLRTGMHTVRLCGRLLIEELPAALRLARVARSERADVLHLGNGVRANFDGILAGLLTGIPVVCHVKGFEKYEWRERWAARRVSTLVCMTRAVLEHCRRCGIESPDSRVVYDAVDEAWLQPVRDVAAVRAELSLPAGAVCVGIAGNIQPWKGQRVFVDAIARLVETLPHLHGLIIGGVHRAGREYAEQIKRGIADAGLGERIHWTGFREDVVDVVNALDLVVHASVRPEPFGRVILEGMLLGKPVIATNAGGVPELIKDGETGYLVPPDDVDALATRIRAVVDSEDLGRAMGEHARQRAREQFSLQRQVAEMSTIYEAAARSH